MKKIALLLILCLLLSVCLTRCEDILASGILTGEISDKVDWLDSSKIVRIEMKSYGCEPDSIESCRFTEDKDAIKTIVNHYGNIEVIRCPELFKEELDGGTTKKLTLFFADGSTRFLSFNSYCYIDSYDKTYIYIRDNSLDLYLIMDYYLHFSAHKKEYSVYTNADTKFAVLSPEDIESYKFVHTDYTSEEQLEASMYIKLDYETIYIISNTAFYTKYEHNMVTYYTCYELIDGYSFENLFELLED